MLAATPVPAAAQEVGGSVTSFGMGDWLGLLLRLALVVGVIWAAVYAMRWYARRAGGERGSVTRSFDIVETRALGPNRALHLVRIGGRAVLIGATPERINALMEVDDPAVLDGIDAGDGRPSRAATAFSTLLEGFGVGARASAAGDPVLAPPLSTPSGDASVAGSPGHASRRGMRGMLAGRRARARATSPSPQRPLVDRVLGLLGFTPLEPSPDVIERMRAVRRAAAEATRPATSAPAPPAPAARENAAVPAIAPSATQTLRALSRYRAAQETTGVDPAAGGGGESEREAGREAQILEAQRAIVAARRAG